MSISYETLISTLDQLNVRHFPDPGNDATLLPYRTPIGDVLVVARVECNGDYLSFQAQMPSECHGDHRLGTLIAQQNYAVRLVQLGSKGSTVCASTGLWIMDAKLTPKVLDRYLDNIVGVASRAFAEIRDAVAGKRGFCTEMLDSRKPA